MKDYIVQKRIELKAKPEEVWDALTNPDKTKKYFFKCEVHSTWKKGNSIKFKRKFLFFFNFELKGKIVEIEALKLLKYTLKNSRSSSESTVTIELVPENEITTLIITDDVGQGEGAEKRYKRSIKGWDKILNGLKKFVEEN